MAEQMQPPAMANQNAVGDDPELAELIRAGFAAMAAFDWATARDHFEAATRTNPEPAPEILEGLAVSIYLLGFIADSRRPMERAFAAFRASGQPRRALQAATFLVGTLDSAGDFAASAGWEGRARRLLEETGDCVEEGYLALARVGCNIPNPTDLEANARRALRIAQRFGDQGLETRALGDCGLALVSQGRVDEGLALLDEAMVAIVSGEVAGPAIVGMTICAMLSACERAGDIGRLESWSREIEGYAERLGRPPYLHAHCHTVYGAVLALSGRWADAETELLSAVDGPVFSHRNEAKAQLARLRIRQGRPDEAAELLAGIEHELEAAPAVGHLWLSRGDFAAAVVALERALRVLGSDRLRAAPMLALLVQARLGSGEVLPAREAAGRLLELAGACDSREIRAEAHLAAARVALHAGTPEAVEELEAALALLARQDRPHLVAQIRLELARAMEASDPAAATQEGEVAAAGLARLGAATMAVPAAPGSGGFAAPIGHSGRESLPAPTSTPESLTRRESELAVLVAEGLLNREIADRLFLSVRTVESHVNNAMAKLGFRTRTQLAVWVEGRAANS